MTQIREAARTVIRRPGGTALHFLRKLRGVFLVNVAGNALALGLQVLLTRTLGLQGFGHYIYALTWINLCVLVAKFGLDTAALRFIPEYVVREKWQLLKGFLRSSTLAVTVSSLCVSALVAVIIVLTGSRWDPEVKSALLLACLLLPLNAILIVRGSHLQGLKHVTLAQSPQVILRPVLLALCLITGSQITSLHGAAGTAMTLNIATTLAAIAVMSIISRTVYPSQLLQSEARYELPHWGRAALSMMFITSFSLVLNQADLIMVGTMVSTADAGIYAAASRVAAFQTFAITLINSIAAPMMAQFYAQGNLPQLQRMLTYVAWASFVFSTPLCLGFIFWSNEIMHVFGSGFSAGATALAILAAGRWVNALTGAAGYLLAMSGHERQAAYILGGNALLNVALNFVLIPVYRIDGAAIATLITTVSWSLMMLAYGKRYIGINASISLRGV